MSEPFKIKEKCPKCGGVMETQILSKGCNIWCTECDYFTTGNSMKARELIFDNIFIGPPKRVKKTGTKLLVSNKPYYITWTIDSLLKMIEDKVVDQTLAEVLIREINKNPKEYEKYLYMDDPLGELLADWE